MKVKRAITEPLGDLKHRLEADRIQLVRVVLHLREFNVNHNPLVICDVIQELEDFNTDRMGDLFDRVNKLIEEA